MSNKKVSQESQLMPDSSKTYPRVLLVYMACINKADQHAASLRSWFAEWPKESLAQIYSSAEALGEKFCGQTYKLGPGERYFGKLFRFIKASTFGKSSNLLMTEEDNSLTLTKMSKWSKFLSKFSRFLLNTGLWEFIFYPKLSTGLVEWIEKFLPQVIYCQGYSLTFCWLALMISKKFHIPIVFQTTDDWPNYLYKNSPLHPIVIRTARQLMKKASMRFAICNRMAEGYKKQFDVSLKTLMICDNMGRFSSVVAKRVIGKEFVSIIYSGLLSQGRWQSLLDLCSAAIMLKNEGYNIMITVFTSAIPFEAVNILQENENIQILPPLEHELLPAYLKGADILFLPETFIPSLAKEIRYSISSKSQLYMMSQQPILVYGSQLAGVVDYAKRDGWAYVVDQRRIDLLTEALRKLITDIDLRRKLTETARIISLRNHKEEIVRKEFLKAIQSTISEVQV